MTATHEMLDRLTTSHRLTALIRQQRRSHYRRLINIIGLLGLVGASFLWVGLLDWSRLSQGVPDFFDMVGEMLPPDFSRAKYWGTPLLDTLAMSVAGTAIALFGSLPLALCAARNTTPHPILYYLSRILLNSIRAIPELILGMILVGAVGFGKLPGTLALGIHSIGMVGKFFSESIELTDPAPIEAARSVGATDFQVIVHCLLPQVFPQIADVSLYRWEYNLRASIVLGAVGAGGIGIEIISALRILKYQEVSALLLVVLVMVTVVDSLSNHLRKYFVD